MWLNNRGKYSKLLKCLVVTQTNFSLLHTDKNVMLLSPGILLTVVVSIHKWRRLKSWCGFRGQNVTVNQGLLTEALYWATKKDNCAALPPKAPQLEDLLKPRLPPQTHTHTPLPRRLFHASSDFSHTEWWFQCLWNSLQLHFNFKKKMCTFPNAQKTRRP